MQPTDSSKPTSAANQTRNEWPDGTELVIAGEVVHRKGEPMTPEVKEKMRVAMARAFVEAKRRNNT